MPNLTQGAACLAFGSFVSPEYRDAQLHVPPVPSTTTPRPQGAERLGFAMIVPAGAPPDGGWPVVLYGPGFTRSYFDLFVSADTLAAAGLAVIATHPAGHGFGAGSTIQVGPPGAGDEFRSYGRGSDVDDDGEIGPDEGVQPLGEAVVEGGEVVDRAPSPVQLAGLSDGLFQTVVDNAALLRAVRSGVTVPGCLDPADVLGDGVPLPDAPDELAALTDVELSSTDVGRYFGISFGGIYGTMLTGADPTVEQAYFSVPGGPITEIARSGGFRSRAAEILRDHVPDLRNGGPGLAGFTESIPLPVDPRVTDPAPGSAAIRDYLSLADTYQRHGSPETFSPLLRRRVEAGAQPRDVVYQISFGDNTVPNQTSGNLVRAGGLEDRVTYYRNDQSPTRETNPHGVLADPTVFGRVPLQAQLTTFLSTGEVVDPDGPGPVFEVPITDAGNLRCLHYPDPQTGQGAYPPAAAGECPEVPAEPTARPAQTGSDDDDGTGGGGTGAVGGPTTTGTGGSDDVVSRGAGTPVLAATGGAAASAVLALAALGGALLLGRRLRDG